MKIQGAFRYGIFLSAADALYWFENFYTEEVHLQQKQNLFGSLLPPGSAEERRVYRKALAKILGTSVSERLTDSPAGRPSETMRNPGIAGKFKLAEPPVFGKDINLILVLNNLASDHKSIRVDMSASTILYTRRTVAEILKAATSVELGPKQGNFSCP